MIEIILIPLIMAILAGYAGGSLPYSWVMDKLKITWLPEALFAFGIGYALYPIISFYALIAIIWSYLWVQTGHGQVLSWGKNNKECTTRKQTLTPIIDPIVKKLGVYCTKWHSWIFMSLKGFLIALPVGGVLNAVLWPLSYEIGYQLRERKIVHNPHWITECLSGFFVGVQIVVFKAVI